MAQVTGLGHTGLYDGDKTLDILVVAPLPFYRNGVRAFNVGVSIFYTDLLPHLARLGHIVRVIAEAPVAQEGELRTGLSWDTSSITVEWFAFDFQTELVALPQSYRETARSQLKPVFDRLVQERRPDIVILGRETLARHGVELCQEHHLPSFLIAHGVPTAALLQDPSYPDNLRRELIGRFRQIDWIVTVGKHLEEILRTFGVTRVCTISNVIDTARFFPMPKDQQLLKELRIAPHQVVVSHLSNLTRGKRPLDVVSSAEIVLRSRPEVVYVIMGNGPCRQEMEELSRKKGIAPSFRYLGEIDNQQMPRYLSISDIVLLPSEREGFPLVYRETQACGRVLLVSDIPAAREAIVDGETGLLCRLGDVQDLAAKTLLTIQDPALRRRIGEQSRAMAAAEDPLQWAQAYADILRRTAMSRKSSR